MCAADRFCRGARCRTCEEDGLKNCNGQCSDLLSDSKNCGTCGNACSAAEQCRNGNCVNPCPEGQLSCSDKCIDPTVDAQNCGSCGHVCPAGQTCNASACTCADTNLVSCDGICLNPKKEKNHCGATPGCGFNTGWSGSACLANGYCSEGNCHLCQAWTKTWTFQRTPISNQAGLRAAVADFNNDTKLDVAVLDLANAKLDILLGNGDGTFRAGTSFAVGSSPIQLVVLDYDGDGKKDLAVGNRRLTAPPAFDYLVVYHGNGDGTFAAGASIDRETAVESLAAGDIDGDGRDDLLATGGDWGAEDVRVYVAKANGAFALGANFAKQLTDINSSASVTDLAITDVDGDGHADFVFSPTTILFGKGDGTFGDSWSAPIGIGGYDRFVIADFNGDGKRDVFWRGSGVANQWWLAPGDGGRTWKYPSLVLFSGSFNVTLADVTGDGIRDLVGVGGGYPSHLYVRGGRGDGTFVAEEQYDFSTDVAGVYLTTADLDGNGITDIISSSYDSVIVLTGQKSARPECQ
ncbi:Tryptophan synthase alpha chain [Labilithrix luteola]|uniref:Tryptophan synthase alpha chain n=1 Tax=Labilithrix luteola TaxID=1391654 RepID=A0A0K1PVJ6_9BACT|nr:Tryptophan synthase alpha chain [Labilithrix luteola]